MPSALLPSAEASAAVPLHFVGESGYGGLLATLDERQRRWAERQQFRPERGRWLLLPDAAGAPALAIAGLGALAGPQALSHWDAAALAERLPAGSYVLAAPLPAAVADLVALGWLLGSQRPERLGQSLNPVIGPARLVCPEGASARFAECASAALLRARELVNRPANLLGPEELAAAASELARRLAGSVHITAGEELKGGFPLVHAVGCGSARAPRFIALDWPRPGAPRVVLVGKGVCFDSGGLDIKPSAGMLLMKKDMGGAACALALAELLVTMDAPIELAVLIPAVENSIGGRAFRPGDVYRSRKGLTVEIGNTDAEGRLILADALALAEESRPELIIDLATLTGAARVALGPELPAAFGSDEALPQELARLGAGIHDPVWPMPLWSGYDDELASRIADVNNAPSGSFGGAITAALFLRRFLSPAARWLHLDLYAWNPRERPGRPQGAEAQAVRALYALLRQLYG